MIQLPENVTEQKRRLLGPLGRFVLKISNWEIRGEIPNYKRMVLVGVPHTAMRDAWYCLLYTSPSPRDATLSRMPSSA